MDVCNHVSRSPHKKFTRNLDMWSAVQRFKPQERNKESTEDLVVLTHETKQGKERRCEIEGQKQTLFFISKSGFRIYNIS